MRLGWRLSKSKEVGGGPGAAPTPMSIDYHYYGPDRRPLLKKIDWSRVLNYAWNVALLAGSVAVQIYAPGLAPILLPALQAAGQFGPSRAGVTLLKDPD